MALRALGDLVEGMTAARLDSPEVAAIKAKTDLIPASPAATGDIPSAAAVAAAVADEFATAADAVEASPSPAADEFAGSSSLSSTDDFYVGAVLVFTGGDLDGLARKITDYTGSTRLLGEAFTTRPRPTAARAATKAPAEATRRPPAPPSGSRASPPSSTIWAGSSAPWWTAGWA